MSFAHQSTSPGVSVHGLLTGLDADDHLQYALGDKSRPDPWVAALDLAPRSLADLGARAHDLLTGLADDDHSIYPLLTGRNSGQTLIGGLAASEHLTLQSTAHATRGYVRAQDDLQLLTNCLRDSGGNQRVKLKTSSPHVSITGDLDVGGSGAFGSLAAPDASRLIYAYGEVATHPGTAGNFTIQGTKVSGAQFIYGLAGAALAMGTPTIAYAYGLFFYTQHNTPSPCGQLVGIYHQLQSGAAGSGALTLAKGLWLYAASWSGSKPATVYGIDIEEHGGAGVTMAYGLHLTDQTATTVRLLEIGPGTPYLRLIGGAAPAANLTNLYLNEGGTLRCVQVMDPGAGGANFAGGERVAILV
jgi:hypothetical protein